MKKIIGLIVFVVFMTGVAYSRTSITSFPTETMTVTAVTLSSQTATAVAAANTKRKGIIIYNDSAYTIYLATGAVSATIRSSQFPIESKGVFSDNIEAFEGAWYGLGSDGIATASNTLKVIEKSILYGD